MCRDVEKWGARYRVGDSPPSSEPAEFLRELLPVLPRGRALDLASGAGRNAVFLAARGWRVMGVDISREALEKAAMLARQHGIAVRFVATPEGHSWPQFSGLLLLEADLERCALPVGRFDLVVCFKYLQRSLFAAMERSLRRGGMLVYESYTLEQLAFPHGPRNPDHLLRPGELRRAFPNLETLFYREICVDKAIASLLARNP